MSIYGVSRCKHGVIMPMRCRDCEMDPIDEAELARFKRDILGIEDDAKADLAPASGAQVQRLIGRTEPQETKP